MLLYAWCRYCDDLIDGQHLGRGIGDGSVTPLETLARLRDRTRAVFRGETPADPEFAALAAVVRRHEIPRGLRVAHLDGFAMDVEGRVYHSLDDTLEYCYAVAGVVGLMMAHVMGARRRTSSIRACDLRDCLSADQLVARDVVERRDGPRLSAERLAAGSAHSRFRDGADTRHRAALTGVVARLLREPSRITNRPRSGLGTCRRVQPGRSQRRYALYRAIGTEVTRRGEAAWNERAVTSRAAKLGAVIGGGSRGACRDCFRPVQGAAVTAGSVDASALSCRRPSDGRRRRAPMARHGARDDSRNESRSAATTAMNSRCYVRGAGPRTARSRGGAAIGAEIEKLNC